MWIFTKTGFVSAVQHATAPGMILVRARVRGDIDAFLAPVEERVAVQETPTADYRFRTAVTRADFETAVAAAARAIDYTNFKDAAHEGTERDFAYMDVWTAMRFLQERMASNEAWRAKAAAWNMKKKEGKASKR